MANYIKYSTNAQTRALKMGNFWLGPVNDGKGPTSSTGYYTALNPPSGGFTIYLNKASNGPSIYQASNESQLVSITNQIGGTSFTTSAQCLTWYVTQTDKICVNRDYESIVTNGLVLNFDAGFTPSYPTSGTSWYDLGPSGNTGTLTNGPTFSSTNGGSIVFDGADDVIIWNSNPLSSLTSAKTYEVWIKFTNTQNTFTLGCGTLNVYLESRTWYVSQVGSTDKNITTWTFSSGWTNFVYSFDGTNHLCYINGVSYVVNSSNAGVSSQTNLYLGNRVNLDSPMKGNMAITRVYNRGLTASEILQNYNAQKGRFGL